MLVKNKLIFLITCTLIFFIFMNFGYAFCACINADDLAPGLSCVELNGSCDYSIDSSSILYKNINQLWHANVIAASSSGSCNIPDVTVTPIEST